MRIISGSARGRKLRAPGGAKTRPTSDRVREAIFSQLTSRIDIAQCRVLDLYAGTGALGLEALSRGAQSAHFVDIAAACVRVIQQNAEATNLVEQCEIVKSPADRALDRLARDQQRFELVFVDPPYRFDVQQILSEIAAAAVLEHEGYLILEYDAHGEVPLTCGVLSRVAERRYGDTGVALYVSETNR